MKFASIRDGTPDGALMVVSGDLRQAAPAGHIAPNLLHALVHWEQVAPDLAVLAQDLAAGHAAGVITFDPRQCMAPLPRSPQWCDGSAFLNHGRLMDRAFGNTPIPDFDTIPVMYQGASDDFLGPCDDVPLPSEEDGIDFEGEFAVVVGDVPMACPAAQALGHVRLLMQANDWSLRALGPREMRSGFGFLQAKPSTSFAPVAITPDELAGAWQHGRLNLLLNVQCNGERIGEPNAREMNFHFGELIAHAARTRRLTAGTIIGSGTVSNLAREAGSACLAERRVIELLDHGATRTAFLRFGDRVRMEARFTDGQPGPFGVIDQRVVRCAVAAPTTA